MLRLLSKTLIIGLLLLVTACTANRPLPSPYYSLPVSTAATQDESLSWWAYRFRINWPEQLEQPDFAVDLMLAHGVIKPVLEEHAGEILWWRFHRRAARSAPGHQFSFIFYCDAGTAQKIINEIEQSGLLSSAINSNIIEKTVSPASDAGSKPALNAFSDPSWSPEIQQAWPSYIMGVSAFWLALIDELHLQHQDAESDNSREGNDAQSQLEYYREIDAAIAEIWEQEGQHALLHHLSAVFGYKPMLLKKNIVY